MASNSIEKITDPSPITEWLHNEQRTKKKKKKKQD